MRRFVENYVFALSADAIQRLSGALLVVWVSRRLGVEEAGIFFLAVTFATLFGRLSYWGLDQLLTRDVAKEPGRANQFMVNFIFVRTVMASLVMAALYATIIWLGYAPHTSHVILLLSLTILPDSLINICQSVFMAYEQMSYLTVSSLLNGIVRIAAGVLAITAGFGLEGVALGLSIASVSTLVFSVYLIRSRLFRPTWTIDWGFCRQQLTVAFPFLWIGVFFILDNQLDVLLLSKLGDEYQVGLYGAATTVVGALILIPFAFRTVVLPIMSRLQAKAPSALGHLYNQSFKYLLLAGLPIASGATLLASEIVTLVFGPTFAPSTLVLQILVWSLFFTFPNVLNSRLLVVIDQQRIIAIFLFVSLAVNVVLNLLLVPRWGAAGSAVARVVSTFVLFLVMARFVARRVYSVRILPLLVRPAIAATAMIGSLIVLREWSMFLLIPIGAFIYITVLAALRTFSQEDLMLWRQVTAQYPLMRSGRDHG